jgi:hypothetical protein
MFLCAFGMGLAHPFKPASHGTVGAGQALIAGRTQDAWYRHRGDGSCRCWWNETRGSAEGSENYDVVDGHPKVALQVACRGLLQ